MPSLVYLFLYISLLVSPLLSNADTDTPGIKLAESMTPGLIEGDDFFEALLSVWPGSEPADQSPKAELPGN
jgi:hypothetical protein